MSTVPAQPALQKSAAPNWSAVEASELEKEGAVKPEIQELLTRVGPGTPMGDLLRRYWFPVAGSAELEPGSTRAVRLLGEDLVLFRSLRGEPGLLDHRCPHRGASLRYGIVDDEGVSCPYHGWKFDGSGTCLGMPAERGATARLLERARVRSYVTQELGGLIFAYLGPAPAPLLPRYDLYVRDNVLRDIGRASIPCNWLQIMENSVDPTHVEWLHGHHLASVRARAGQTTPTHYRRRHKRIAFSEFEYGIVKRRLLEGANETDEDWTVGHPLIFPVTLRVGADRQHRFQIRVPVDDENTLHFWYACYVPPAGHTLPVQQVIPVYDVPWLDEDGGFRTDFVDGGDIMAWVTQGAIADRTREMLVGSDKGIAMYRRLLLRELDRIRLGKDPMGVIRDPGRNACIDFPQESDKYRGGKGFLAETLEMSHARYSPIKGQIIELLKAD